MLAITPHLPTRDWPPPARLGRNHQIRQAPRRVLPSKLACMDRGGRKAGFPNRGRFHKNPMHGVGDALGLVGIAVYGVLARNLRQGTQIGSYHAGAGRHCLEDRQAEPLEERRKDQRLRPLHEHRQESARYVSRQVDFHLASHSAKNLMIPSSCFPIPDNEKIERPAWTILSEDLAGTQDIGDVLPIFDAAHEDEIGPARLDADGMEERFRLFIACTGSEPAAIVPKRHHGALLPQVFSEERANVRTSVLRVAREQSRHHTHSSNCAGKQLRRRRDQFAQAHGDGVVQDGRQETPVADQVERRNRVARMDDQKKIQIVQPQDRAPVVRCRIKTARARQVLARVP